MAPVIKKFADPWCTRRRHFHFQHTVFDRWTHGFANVTLQFTRTTVIGNKINTFSRQTGTTQSDNITTRGRCVLHCEDDVLLDLCLYPAKTDSTGLQFGRTHLLFQRLVHFNDYTDVVNQAFYTDNITTYRK